jgi:hypothetical protein
MEFMESEGSAYKIYNRATGIRGYFPLNLECAYENQQAPWLYTFYTKLNSRCGENTYYRCYMQKDFKLVKVLGPDIKNKKKESHFLLRIKVI